MKVYQVLDWNLKFENERSRRYNFCRFVCVPNKQHGMGFTRLMSLPDGAAIYGMFHMIIGACSQQKSPREGWLTDDGGRQGRPWWASDLAVRFRQTEANFTRALEILSSPEIGWLGCFESPENSASLLVNNTKTPVAHRPPTLNPPVTPIEQNRNRTGKEQEQNRKADAISILELLNLITGKSFRAVDSNLRPIQDRLSEPGVTEEGVAKMISRQVELWGSDSKMSEFLRPETLFRKSKFESYYAAKDSPVPSKPNENTRNESMGITSQRAREEGRKTAELVRAKMERRKSETSNGTLFKTP